MPEPAEVVRHELGPRHREHQHAASENRGKTEQVFDVSELSVAPLRCSRRLQRIGERRDAGFRPKRLTAAAEFSVNH